jgi:hypothetical protein
MKYFIPLIVACIFPIIANAEGLPYNNLPSDFKPYLGSTLPTVQTPVVKIQQQEEAVPIRSEAIATPKKAEPVKPRQQGQNRWR